MLKIRKQAHIRIGEWRSCAGLEVLHRSGGICATNDVQPFLHIVLMLKLSTLTRTRGLKKSVQVELVKLSGTSNRHKFIGHLVGE